METATLLLLFATALQSAAAQTPFQDCGKHLDIVSGLRWTSIFFYCVAQHQLAWLSQTSTFLTVLPGCVCCREALTWARSSVSRPVSQWWLALRERLSVLCLYADQPFSDLKNVMVGYLLGEPIPFELPHPSVCDHGVQCPMRAGETVTEKISSYIQKDFPQVREIEHHTHKTATLLFHSPGHYHKQAATDWSTKPATRLLWCSIPTEVGYNMVYGHTHLRYVNSMLTIFLWQHIYMYYT